VKPAFLLGCYGCFFRGTENSAWHCQKFGISGVGVEHPNPLSSTPLIGQNAARAPESFYTVSEKSKAQKMSNFLFIPRNKKVRERKHWHGVRHSSTRVSNRHGTAGLLSLPAQAFMESPSPIQTEGWEGRRRYTQFRRKGKPPKCPTSCLYHVISAYARGNTGMEQANPVPVSAIVTEQPLNYLPRF
jgi:hypothetical protein